MAHEAEVKKQDKTGEEGTATYEASKGREEEKEDHGKQQKTGEEEKGEEENSESHCEKNGDQANGSVSSVPATTEEGESRKGRRRRRFPVSDDDSTASTVATLKMGGGDAGGVESHAVAQTAQVGGDVAAAAAEAGATDTQKMAEAVARAEEERHNKGRCKGKGTFAGRVAPSEPTKLAFFFALRMNYEMFVVGTPHRNQSDYWTFMSIRCDTKSSEDTIIKYAKLYAACGLITSRKRPAAALEAQDQESYHAANKEEGSASGSGVLLTTEGEAKVRKTEAKEQEKVSYCEPTGKVSYREATGEDSEATSGSGVLATKEVETQEESHGEGKECREEAEE